MPNSAVLVVEDEPFLRMAAVMMFEEAGFDAVEAASAEAAVAILEGRVDIRTVFTDIDMPGGMNGLWLAAQVRDRWPPIRIIVTSGHWDISDTKLPADVAFFAKPYNEEQVLAEARRTAA